MAQSKKSRLIETPSDRRVGEIAYATAFVLFYREALKRKLSYPGAYAANEALLVSIEAIDQWADLRGPVAAPKAKKRRS